HRRGPPAEGGHYRCLYINYGAHGVVAGGVGTLEGCGASLSSSSGSGGLGHAPSVSLSNSGVTAFHFPFSMRKRQDATLAGACLQRNSNERKSFSEIDPAS